VVLHLCCKGEPERFALHKLGAEGEFVAFIYSLGFESDRKLAVGTGGSRNLPHEFFEFFSLIL
jgi:hypothetical protein